MSLPPLKTDPKYGHYPWCPEDGNDWLHPEDVARARRLIPSPRIFRRDGERGPYVVLHYGKLRLRVKRTLWQEVAHEGYDIGDWVEVLSLGMQNTPRTGVICEMEWNAHERAIRYQIREGETVIPTWYAAGDMRRVEPIVDGADA